MELIQECAELRRQGLTVRQIGDRLNLPPNQVQNRLNAARQGVVSRKRPSAAPKKVREPTRADHIRELVTQGKLPAEIEEILGLSRRVVTATLNSFRAQERAADQQGRDWHHAFVPVPHSDRLRCEACFTMTGTKRTFSRQEAIEHSRQSRFADGGRPVRAPRVLDPPPLPLTHPSPPPNPLYEGALPRLP